MNAPTEPATSPSVTFVPPRQQKKKARWWLRILIVVAIAGVVGVVVKTQTAEEKPLEEALITPIKKVDLMLEVIDTGRIEPFEKVDIKSKVSGQVLEVLVDEGAVVTKGQLLLRLDPVDYAREVARSEAELAQAKQAVAFAELTLTRRQAALQERAIAAAEVEIAQNEVDMKKATVKIAEVAVSAARDRLRSCEIKSPLAGTVIARGVEPGEVVTAGVQATVDGKPLMTIADLSTLIVRSELNQIDVARIVLGQVTRLGLDALPGRNFDATVTKIAPAAVKSTTRDAEVFPVEATLAGSDSSIKSGMTADVRIQVGVLPQVLVVPIEAVINEEGKHFVKLVVVGEDTKKRAGEKREVKIGKSNDRQMQIIEDTAGGIKEGVLVVIDPASSKDNEAKL